MLDNNSNEVYYYLSKFIDFKHINWLKPDFYMKYLKGEK